MSDSLLSTKFVRIHGHRVAYREIGDGERGLIVCIHGIAGRSSTFTEVMPGLAAAGYRVIAPDLLGHGESAKPRGDYSLGAYAAGVRDLLVALGHDRATVVGHSLGGGIAMQFAYQFPERVERLVLVGSGGLGKQVHPFLRALTLPGAEFVLPLALVPQLNRVIASGISAIGRVGLHAGRLLQELFDSYTMLTDPRAQRAFVHTVRSVIDVAGQRVSAHDRLYLTSAVPTLIVWGERDSVIPIAHAHLGHAAMPGSRLEIHPDGGHFVPVEFPQWFVDHMVDFLATTEPATATEADWQRLLVSVPATADTDLVGDPADLV